MNLLKQTYFFALWRSLFLAQKNFILWMKQEHSETPVIFFYPFTPKAQYHRKKIIKYGNNKIIFSLTIWFYAPHLGSFEIAEDNHQPVFHLVLRYKVHQALTNILLRKENQYYPSLNNYNDKEDKYKTFFHLVWHKGHQHQA